jgi:hypothetical protein
VDSSLKTGPLVSLSPPMSRSVSSIQIFQCSLSLVNQTAIVDAQSRQLQALGPDFKKTDSTWVPYVSPLINVTTNGNYFIDAVRDPLPLSSFTDCASGGHGTSGCLILTFRFSLVLVRWPLWQICKRATGFKHIQFLDCGSQIFDPET